MNEYIFYTTEGHTDAPNRNFEVENCQVIGRAKGSTSDEAMKSLLNENDWILEAGFNPEDFIAKQILSDEQRNDTLWIVNYLWNEVNDFTGNEDRKNRLVHALKRLNEMYSTSV